MTDYTATYSAEDNKLRLYASTRLDDETFARIKEAGFRWAPKQELFVAPRWTPAREDILTDLAGEIEPEGTTMAERAEAKAERLDALANKRAAQSNAFMRASEDLARAFEGGQPILVGHHSERKARKTQERMHALADKAVKAHRAIDYWQWKAESVQHHANRKNSDRTRANRIKTLLKELRDLQRAYNHAALVLEFWERNDKPEQAAHVIERGLALPTGDLIPWRWAYDDATKDLTPEEMRLKAMENARAVLNGPKRARWIAHVLGRLSYERSMFGDVPRFGGTVTPVILQAFAREHGAHKPKATATEDGRFILESTAPLPLHIADGKTLDLDAGEWADLMQSAGYAVPEPTERRKSSKPKPATLINPTLEDAEKLQALWAKQMQEACAGKGIDAKENTVTQTTQARYSALSKGDYGPGQTVEIGADGRRIRGTWQRMEYVKTGEPVCRIRINTGGGDFHKPDSVCHITDKPAKALPLDFAALMAPQMEAAE